MQTRRFRVYISLLLSGLTLIAAELDAEQRNIVRTLDLTQLDRIIKTGGNRRVIVVMAAWCRPCIKELPDLNKIYAKYASKGLKMMGISLDFAGPEAIQPVVDEHKVKYPVYWVGEKAIQAYSIRRIPLIMLVKNGEITDTIKGKRTRKILEKTIREFLDE
jgi:thiol-disulfide isomerase/thioredoxin